MSSMAAAAARCRSLTARALARPALANHRGLSRPTLVANHRLLASATTTTTTTTAAASGLQLNIPSAVAELEIEQGPDVSTLKSLGLRRSILFRGLGRGRDL